MSRSEGIVSQPSAVRAACHVSVSFDTAAPQDAELVIDHLHIEQLLARERRPLEIGATSLEIKTHPEASAIACSLRAGGRRLDGVQFNLDCGPRIQPISRHVIVIGAMKAGTTTLFELLAQHPALCRTWAEVPGVSFTKEINYFNQLYRSGHTPLHYDWRFPFDAGRHAWTLDVSPNYAKWPGTRPVPARIASLGGETRLIYILREPVDRIESHLAHNMRVGREIKNQNYYVRISQYARQLDRFTEHFPREAILLLDFEKLRRDPAAVLAQVCDFLAINLFVTRSMVHNRRGVDFRLDAKQRADFTETVRPDVQRLIDYYGFKPAKKWLRRSALSWLRLPGIRR